MLFRIGKLTTLFNTVLNNNHIFAIIKHMANINTFANQRACDIKKMGLRYSL